MEKVIENLEKRFTTVRAGRASPSSLDKVLVSYYGVDTPIKGLATISVPEARQLLIRPFDRTIIPAIEKAIIAANLGYTPNNDGEAVRINIPVLTEERRKELVKQIKGMAEDAKIAIRNIRHDLTEDIKKLQLPEDIEKRNLNDLQEKVTKFNKIIEEKTQEKEEELLIV